MEKKKRMTKSRPPSTADYMTIKTGSQLITPAAGSLMGSQLIAPKSQHGGSQMYINKSDRSVLGSQYVITKGTNDDDDDGDDDDDDDNEIDKFL